MPGQIDTFKSFTGWQGMLVEAHRRATLLPAQAGLDGHEVARDGWSTDPATIITYMEVTDLAASKSWIESFRELMNATTGITVVEPIGRIWSNVIVLDVRSMPFRTITGTIRIATTWRLLPPTYQPA